MLVCHFSAGVPCRLPRTLTGVKPQSLDGTMSNAQLRESLGSLVRLGRSGVPSTTSKSVNATDECPLEFVHEDVLSDLGVKSDHPTWVNYYLVRSVVIIGKEGKRRKRVPCSCSFSLLMCTLAESGSNLSSVRVSRCRWIFMPPKRCCSDVVS